MNFVDRKVSCPWFIKTLLPRALVAVSSD